METLETLQNELNIKKAELKEAIEFNGKALKELASIQEELSAKFNEAIDLDTDTFMSEVSDRGIRINFLADTRSFSSVCELEFNRAFKEPEAVTVSTCRVNAPGDSNADMKLLQLYGVIGHLFLKNKVFAEMVKEMTKVVFDYKRNVLKNDFRLRSDIQALENKIADIRVNEFVKIGQKVTVTDKLTNGRYIGINTDYRVYSGYTLEIKKISPKKVVVDLTANSTLYPKISIKRETMEYIIKKELLEGEV